MANTSLDIVLNAVDNTGPATASASHNLRNVAQAASESSQSDSGDGGIAAIVAGLIDLGTVAAIAAAAVELFGGSIVGVAVSAASTMEESGDSIVNTISSIIEGTFDWSGMFSEVVKDIVAGEAIIEYAFRNWQTVGELALTTIELGVVRVGNIIQYYFAEVIPALLIYLSDNWRDIFKSIADYVQTVVTNMYEDLVNFFAAVISWLHGDGFDFKWTGLEEGFKSSLKELPNILDREKGPLETQLEDMVGGLTKIVGAGVSDLITRRVAQVPDLIPKLNGIGEDILHSDFFKDLFGLRNAHENTGSLPSLSNERFTTGVNAAGQESMMETAFADLRESKGILNGIAKFLDHDLPRPIRDGVKGVFGGTTAGIPLGG